MRHEGIRDLGHSLGMERTGSSYWKRPLSQETQVIADHMKGRLLELWFIKLWSEEHST